MYTLYYKPGACSMAVHVTLNELNEPFKAEDVYASESSRREFLKNNPLGQIPVLKDGEQTIREGAAILLHLADKHESPLLPRKGKERDAAIEALMFCNATLHPAYGKAFFIKKNVSDQAAQEKLLAIAADNINRLWQQVESTLGKSAYLAGDSITLADILLCVIANWSGNVPGIKIGAKTKALLQKVISRPAYVKALQAEKVEYKAAA